MKRLKHRHREQYVMILDWDDTQTRYKPGYQKLIFKCEHARFHAAVRDAESIRAMLCKAAGVPIYTCRVVTVGLANLLKSQFIKIEEGKVP